MPNMHPLPTAHCYTAARTARLSCRPRYIYMQCLHHGKRDGWDDIPGAQVVTPGMWYPCRLSIPNPALSYSSVYLQGLQQTPRTGHRVPAEWTYTPLPALSPIIDLIPHQ